jgi:transcription antitermination factor NusG
LTPIYTPSPARWHALTVLPQSEGATEAWLKARGVYSFHPVTRRVVTIRGKRVSRTKRLLPGYVFARFPGVMTWHAVKACVHIAGCIRMASGEPGILRPDDLTALHAMRDVDDAAREAVRRAAIIRPGDKVKILAGLWSDEQTEVIAIRHGKAIVRLTIFGAERDVEVEQAAMVKAG